MSKLALPDKADKAELNFDGSLILVHGGNGMGKTTFAMGADRHEKVANSDHLLIDLDGGSKYLECLKIPQGKDAIIENWEEVQEVLDLLFKQKKPKKVNTWDGIHHGFTYCNDWSAANCIPDTEFDTVGEIPHGKGWRFLKDNWRKFIHDLKKLGTTNILLCPSNDRITKSPTGEKQRSFPDIQEIGLRILLSEVDYVFYVGQEYDSEKKADVHVLFTKPTHQWEAKDRFGELEPAVPLEWSEFARAVKKAYGNSKSSNGRASGKSKKRR